MKVLVTEKLSTAGLERLREKVEVDLRLGLSPAELADAIEDYDGLIVRSATTVDSQVIERGPNLKVIGRAGIGLDNIDVDAATSNGVVVVNAPQSNVLSAAEHTMALLLAQARHIPQAHAALVAGSWARERYQGVELHGKTLGIVGLGRVGALVALRASAFGMRLVAYDPYIAAPRATNMGIEMVSSVTEVCAQADFLTIHLPKTKETVGIISKRELNGAKPGIRIVNTARRADRRAGTCRRVARRPRGRCRSRRLRGGARDRPSSVWDGRCSGHSSPRRLDRGGPGQGGHRHRRAGPSCSRRRVCALRGERGSWARHTGSG